MKLKNILKDNGVDDITAISIIDQILNTLYKGSSINIDDNFTLKTSSYKGKTGVDLNGNQVIRRGGVRLTSKTNDKVQVIFDLIKDFEYIVGRQNGMFVVFIKGSIEDVKIALLIDKIKDEFGEVSLEKVNNGVNLRF